MAKADRLMGKWAYAVAKAFRGLWGYFRAIMISRQFRFINKNKRKFVTA